MDHTDMMTALGDINLNEVARLLSSLDISTITEPETHSNNSDNPTTSSGTPRSR